jgi:hypothetical protein
VRRVVFDGDVPQVHGGTSVLLVPGVNEVADADAEALLACGVARLGPEDASPVVEFATSHKRDVPLSRPASGKPSPTNKGGEKE